MPLATFIRDYTNVLDQVEAADAELILERRSGRSSFVVAGLGESRATGPPSRPSRAYCGTPWTTMRSRRSAWRPASLRPFRG